MISVKEPLVTVVMPVYNAERFLRQAIESVLEQTYSNIELIMIDDCSNDLSYQIMAEYEKRDCRVRAIKGDKNQGVAHVRNRGIQLAEGEYIALLDSDDVWEKTKIERQIRKMEEQKADIAYGSVDFIDENGNKTRRFRVPQTTNYREMLTRCYFICSTVVVKASLLKEHLFRNDFYHEDYLLWLELLSVDAKAVGVTDNVVALYRQIPSSRSYRKLRAAVNRWKIYREALGMGLIQSCIIFAGYAIGGIKKYYLKIY